MRTVALSSHFSGDENEFSVEHPFLFFVCDNVAKSVKLVGRVLSDKTNAKSRRVICQSVILAEEVKGKLTSVDATFPLDLVDGRRWIDGSETTLDEIHWKISTRAKSSPSSTTTRRIKLKTRIPSSKWWRLSAARRR